MSSTLASKISEGYRNPAERSSFFSPLDIKDLDSLYEEREKTGSILSPCDTNLFIGTFFDGTGNNYGDSISRNDHSESNVARLYNTFPGLSVPGVLPPETDWQTNLADYDNFFRIYVPGVGTAFSQVDDSGEGFFDKTLGGGTGRLGEVRILWGLAQVINAVHRYFLKSMLIDNEEVQRASTSGNLDASALQSDPLAPVPYNKHGIQYQQQTIPLTLASWLRRLHRAIANHMSDGFSAPANKEPGVVKNVYVSAFGFSRGAAEARTFSNWLVKLCEVDARLTRRESQGLTLGGGPVTFDFLGIFDTVASVGIANMVPTADGHGAWADAEISLAIPPNVAQCVHLVSAHENRQSFPLDSIYNDHSIASNGEEIVFPGVHSDIGGGYRPGEQGKGSDNIGRDMVSRIPLAVMYRKARLAGVPLKLEQALSDDQDGFKITPKTIRDFNAYIDQCRVKSGETGTIVREHWRRAIEWRLSNHRAGGVTALNSYQRASQYDRNNLASGYRKFQKELERFSEWQEIREKRRRYSRGNPGDEADWIILKTGGDPSAAEDWRRIDEFYPELGTPPEPVAVMMDGYVHDSIAGFLPEWAGEAEVIAYLRELVAKKHILDDSIFWEDKRGIHLTDQEREHAEYYERTGRIPPMSDLNVGENYLLGGGYLRFRLIYAGADDQILTRLQLQTGKIQPQLAFAGSTGAESAARPSA